jgi:hypothetical protein
MVISVNDFRGELRSREALDIVETTLLPNPPAHVTTDQLKYLRLAIASSYGVNGDDVEIVITGSANLGFSLSEKRKSGKVVGARYRQFSPNSDIDVAVISPPIFKRIWQELAVYAANSYRFPIEHGRLGDYLVSGWLRPDHFPPYPHLRYCRNWFMTFSRITAGSQMRRRRVNGGLFYSKFHLAHYMARAVHDCILSEDKL